MTPSRISWKTLPYAVIGMRTSSGVSQPVSGSGYVTVLWIGTTDAWRPRCLFGRRVIPSAGGGIVQVETVNPGRPRRLFGRKAVPSAEGRGGVVAVATRPDDVVVEWCCGRGVP